MQDGSYHVHEKRPAFLAVLDAATQLKLSSKSSDAARTLLSSAVSGAKHIEPTEKTKVKRPVISYPTFRRKLKQKRSAKVSEKEEEIVCHEFDLFKEIQNSKRLSLADCSAIEQQSRKLLQFLDEKFKPGLHVEEKAEIPWWNQSEPEEEEEDLNETNHGYIEPVRSTAYLAVHRDKTAIENRNEDECRLPIVKEPPIRLHAAKKKKIHVLKPEVSEDVNPTKEQEPMSFLSVYQAKQQFRQSITLIPENRQAEVITAPIIKPVAPTPHSPPRSLKYLMSARRPAISLQTRRFARNKIDSVSIPERVMMKPRVPRQKMFTTLRVRKGLKKPRREAIVPDETECVEPEQDEEEQEREDETMSTSLHVTAMLQKLSRRRKMERQPSLLTQLQETDSKVFRKTSTAVVHVISTFEKNLRKTLDERDRDLPWQSLWEEARYAAKEQHWRRAMVLASACAECDVNWPAPKLLKARIYGSFGLWSCAVQELTKALDLKPTNSQLRLQRAEAYRNMQKYDKALLDLRLIILQDPAMVEALLLQSQILLLQRRSNEALEALNDAVKADPRQWRSYYDRGKFRHRLARRDPKIRGFTAENITCVEFWLEIARDYADAMSLGCKFESCVESLGDVYCELYSRGEIEEVDEGCSVIVKLVRQHENLSGAQGNIEFRAALLAQSARLEVLLGNHDAASDAVNHSLELHYNLALAHVYRAVIEAFVLRDNRDLRQIMSELDKATSLNPQLPGPYWLRGTLYVHQCRFKRGLDQYRIAVEINATLTCVWVEIAKLYFVQFPNPLEALDAANEVLQRDPNQSEALLLRAQAQKRLSEEKKALRDYSRIAFMNPTDPYAFALMSQILLKLGTHRKALYAFLMYLNNVDVEYESKEIQHKYFVQRGKAYKILNEHEEAIKEFQNAVLVDPSPENLSFLAEALAAAGHTDIALEYTGRAVAADPNSAIGHARHARCLASMGKYREAIREFDKAVRLEPEELIYLFNRAKVRVREYFRLKQKIRVTKLSKKIRKALEHKPSLLSCIGEAGTRNQMNTQYKACLADLSKCIASDQAHIDALVERASLYEIGGEFNLAHADYATALAHDPHSIAALTGVALLHCRLQEYTRAIGHFDSILAKDKDNALAYYNRGVAYQRLGQLPQASKDYGESLRALPGNAHALRNQSVVLCHLGRFHKAKLCLREALERYPDDISLVTAMGCVLAAVGEHEEAVRFLHRAGRFNPEVFEPKLELGSMYIAQAESYSSETQEMRLDFLKKAKSELLNGILMYPCNLELRLTLARALQLSCDLNLAMQEYNQVLAIIRRGQSMDDKTFERHFHAYEGRALVQLQLGRLEEAVHDLDSAMDICISNDSYIREKYLCFSAKSIRRVNFQIKTRYDSASDSEEEEKEKDQEEYEQQEVVPQSGLLGALSKTMTEGGSQLATRQAIARIMLNKGVLLQRQGNINEAKEMYRNAKHFDPVCYTADLYLATIDLKSCDLSRLARVTRHLPTSYKAHTNYGVAELYAHGASKTAVSSFDQAIHLSPECGAAWANKAVALELFGQKEDAEQCYTQAIPYLPTRVDLYIRRGRLRATQHRLHDSMTDFATAAYLDRNTSL